MYFHCIIRELLWWWCHITCKCSYSFFGKFCFLWYISVIYRHCLIHRMLLCPNPNSDDSRDNNHNSMMGLGQNLCAHLKTDISMIELVHSLILHNLTIHLQNNIDSYWRWPISIVDITTSCTQWSMGVHPVMNVMIQLMREGLIIKYSEIERDMCVMLV